MWGIISVKGHTGQCQCFHSQDLLMFGNDSAQTGRCFKAVRTWKKPETWAGMRTRSSFASSDQWLLRSVCAVPDWPEMTFTRPLELWQSKYNYEETVWPVTEVSHSPDGVAVAGQAAARAVGEEAFFAVLALQPSIETQAGTLTRDRVAVLRVVGALAAVAAVTRAVCEWDNKTWRETLRKRTVTILQIHKQSKFNLSRKNGPIMSQLEAKWNLHHQRKILLFSWVLHWMPFLT